MTSRRRSRRGPPPLPGERETTAVENMPPGGEPPAGAAPRVGPPAAAAPPAIPYAAEVHAAAWACGSVGLGKAASISPTVRNRFCGSFSHGRLITLALWHRPDLLYGGFSFGS